MSELLASFFVEGRARTKGSLTPQPGYGKGGRKVIHMVDSPQSTAWLKAMVREIRKQCGIAPTAGGRKIMGFTPAPYEGPVAVTATFYFEREDIPSHQTPFPTSIDIGDIDKLLRNLLDALTYSGLIKDDRLVVRSPADKCWTGFECKRPGVKASVVKL